MKANPKPTPKANPKLIRQAYQTYCKPVWELLVLAILRLTYEVTSLVWSCVGGKLPINEAPQYKPKKYEPNEWS